MCLPSPKSPPAAPPPPAPAAPAPLATVAPAEGTNRKDSSVLSANRGRGSLRIDRTMGDTAPSGTGLNIPV